MHTQQYIKVYVIPFLNIFKMVSPMNKNARNKKALECFYDMVEILVINVGEEKKSGSEISIECWQGPGNQFTGRKKLDLQRCENLKEIAEQYGILIECSVLNSVGGTVPGLQLPEKDHQALCITIYE